MNKRTQYFLLAALAGGFTAFLVRRYLMRQKNVPMPPSLPDSLPLMACPFCHAELTRQGTSQEGTLNCAGCARVYPVIGGIPRFAAYEALPEQDRRFARFYDWFSYLYLPFSKIALLFFGGEDSGRRQIIRRLEPRGGNVLEVSIGPGVNLPYLLERPDVAEVHGLDLSIGQLQRCQGYMRREGFRAALYQGNAEELPFKDDTFESVFHFGGINFFNDKKKAIAEMIRVAKPGAKIVIGDETEKGARGYEIGLPGFDNLFTKKRNPVAPPVDLVPAEMEEIRCDDSLWDGWFYLLEFRKPV